jgi:hypothetical protein
MNPIIKEPHGYGYATIGCLKPLKLVFSILESEFPLSFNLKYQRFNGKEGLSTDKLYTPVKISLDYT